METETELKVLNKWVSAQAKQKFPKPRAEGTHRFPVVKGLVTIRDVAQQSRTEPGRDETLESC